MKSSTKDKVEGNFHQVKGKVKETGGKAVGVFKIRSQISQEKKNE